MTPIRPKHGTSYDGTAALNNGVVTSTKNFVWSGRRLCEERDASDNVTKRFLGEGEQIGGTNYYFTFDHLGSVREMTDGNGTIRARYDYDPYGRRTKLQGDLDADFGFTGYYVHQPSGLQFALYRAYDADLGRFINRDPIGENGGLNLYDYVGNNPANTTDLSGEFNPYVVIGIGVAVGIGIFAYEIHKTGGKIQNIDATGADFQSTINLISKGADTIEENLQHNPQNYSDIYKGTVIVGERCVFGGYLTKAGLQLDRGQQNIIYYLENAREFNLKLEAESHMAPLETHGALEGDIFNAEAEVERLRYAVQVLSAERARRSKTQ